MPFASRFVISESNISIKNVKFGSKKRSAGAFKQLRSRQKPISHRRFYQKTLSSENIQREFGTHQMLNRIAIRVR